MIRTSDDLQTLGNVLKNNKNNNVVIAFDVIIVFLPSQNVLFKYYNLRLYINVTAIMLLQTSSHLCEINFKRNGPYFYEFF